MSDPETAPDAPAAVDDDPDRPQVADEYLRRVADRLRHSYDLETDRAVRGERFDLYGHLAMESQKQFLHRSINWANHETEEHVFARRQDRLTPSTLDRFVDLGHELAADWIDPDETHQATEFTFVVVVPEITDDVRSFVGGFRDRTLLAFGYYGHYEVNLAVVAPDREAAVASELADVVEAFAFWDREPRTAPESDGLRSRITSWLKR
ncbi:hypothetical protein [Halopenitus persicus]|uniref:DUF8052 domain-containing protein n=1 Tax=Halopenitus persicus TaxID=1048396 RepID=A0A1H3DT77_9EURY|nr:hypothetical protein [Halopenitus persicus]SDX69616.1 hypothetical protein SAMN05216564_101136 [Halopenitus persicus]